MSIQRSGQRGSCATRGSRLQSVEPYRAAARQDSSEHQSPGLADKSFAIVRIGSVIILVAVPGPG